MKMSASVRMPHVVEPSFQTPHGVRKLRLAQPFKLAAKPQYNQINGAPTETMILPMMFAFP